ncbi:MAG TPA: hypothetical protein VHK69_20605, partial [Chitinophagaceae bacterium]|nr:hypothetical protein [Chitinophagaceae bacterium]
QKKYKTTFDEYLLHLDSLEFRREKWALMDEPMLHLFYHSQRHANGDLIETLAPALADFYGDDRFRAIERMTPQHFSILQEATLKEVHTRVAYLHKKVAGLSFFKKWKAKLKK